MKTLRSKVHVDAEVGATSRGGNVARCVYIAEGGGHGPGHMGALYTTGGITCRPAPGRQTINRTSKVMGEESTSLQVEKPPHEKNFELGIIINVRKRP